MNEVENIQNTLTGEEVKKRRRERAKIWAKNNPERRKEIVKKSKQRPESKEKRNKRSRQKYAELYPLGEWMVGATLKYRESEKGKLVRTKARRKWEKNNPEKIKEKEKNLRDELSDCYVIQKLIRDTHLTSKQIRENPELIEIKRLILKTKRLCKTSQNSEQV